jgi:hypothetical protein
MENTTKPFSYTPTITEKQITAYLFEFIKSYLYSIYSLWHEVPGLSIMRMVSVCSNEYYTPKPVQISNEDSEGYFRVVDTHVSITLLYKNRLYDVYLYRFSGEERQIIPVVFITGLSEDAKECSALLEKIEVESVRNSHLHGKYLEIVERDTPPWLEDTGEVHTRIIEVEDTSLDDIFLPEQTKEYIRLFIYSVTNYSPGKKGLRYLLSGKPGTAKTKIIRAIAHACKNRATFLFTSGSERRVNGVFSLAEYFSPVVLCIDDIDFLTGNRNDQSQTRQLAIFLQKLDGFVQKDVFLLATTNDKKLVDLAASRPGRFDMIIDVNNINREQYRSLITNKTPNAEIARLFDDELLDELRTKKVTGAFIANIVKHMEMMADYDQSKMTRQYMTQLIREAQKGFYKDPVPAKEDSLGFGI